MIGSHDQRRMARSMIERVRSEEKKSMALSSTACFMHRCCIRASYDMDSVEDGKELAEATPRCDSMHDAA